jgi:hypothetical protein
MDSKEKLVIGVSIMIFASEENEDIAQYASHQLSQEQMLLLFGHPLELVLPELALPQQL